MDHDECLLWSIPFDGVYEGITDAERWMPESEIHNVWTDNLMIRRVLLADFNGNDAMLRDMENAYSACGIDATLDLIDVQPVPEGMDTDDYLYQGTFVARFK